jgi:hypothetical protein
MAMWSIHWPGDIEPRGIVNAAEANHHAPHGALLKQAAPLFEARVALYRLAAGLSAVDLPSGSEKYRPAGGDSVPVWIIMPHMVRCLNRPRHSLKLIGSLREATLPACR